MDIPRQLTAAFPPSAGMLLERARRQVDDAGLLLIARADYGIEADEMLVELRSIRDKGLIPVEMPWQLIEVLNLTRWADPEKPNQPPFEPGPTGRHGHQTVLFACAILLSSQCSEVSEDSTLARILVCAKMLSAEINEGLACFLTARLASLERTPDTVFFALALLMVAVRLRAGKFTDAELGNFAEWVLAEESLGRSPFALNPNDPMPAAFSLQQGFWQPLAAELDDLAATIQDDAVRINLQLCALITR